jgi:hypothetical protein
MSSELSAAKPKPASDSMKNTSNSSEKIFIPPALQRQLLVAERSPIAQAYSPREK